MCGILKAGTICLQYNNYSRFFLNEKSKRGNAFWMYLILYIFLSFQRCVWLVVIRIMGFVMPQSSASKYLDKTLYCNKYEFPLCKKSRGRHIDGDFNHWERWLYKSITKYISLLVCKSILKDSWLFFGGKKKIGQNVIARNHM